MRHQVLEFRLCPHCTALMPVSAGRCTQCKLSPTAPTPFLKHRGSLKRARAHLRMRNFSRKAIATTLCPNCRERIPLDARRCSECDWIKNDRKRALSAERRRQLAQRVRAALTYERVVVCTHCSDRVRSTTNFCPSCQNPFLAATPRPSLSSQLGASLRQRQARMAVERATLCPTCDIYLPAWAEQCYCCGWSLPAGANMRTALRYLIQSTERKVHRTATRLASRRTPSEDLCPNCDVCIPPTESLCMICGWKPARKRSLRDALHVLQQEKANRAVHARQRRVRVCEHCDLPLLPGDGLCMVCGWKPAPGRLQRLLTARRQSRKAMVSKGRQQLCPNCRTSLTDDARRCNSCGWANDPTRTWARHPRMVWLAPVCLLIYGALLITFLQLADPTNTSGHIDRYGRTGLEGKVKQLSAHRSH